MAKTATFGNKVYYGWPSSDFYSARNLRLALLTLALLTLSHMSPSMFLDIHPDVGWVDVIVIKN